MSPITEDLRARLTAELDQLGPMPDLAPQAARAGARVLRRVGWPRARPSGSPRWAAVASRPPWAMGRDPTQW